MAAGCLCNIVGGGHQAVGAWWARQDGSKAGVGGIASLFGGISRSCLRCKGFPCRFQGLLVCIGCRWQMFVPPWKEGDDQYRITRSCLSLGGGLPPRSTGPGGGSGEVCLV